MLAEVNGRKDDMKLIKYLIVACLFFNAQCAHAEDKLGGSMDMVPKLKANFFCETVKVFLSQKRRTYFDNDDFFLENKIKYIWDEYIHEFIVSNEISDVKFIVIQCGGFVSPKVFSYVVTDDAIYRFYFKADDDLEKLVRVVDLKLNMDANREIFGSISRLQKNYFLLDDRLWFHGDNPIVFCAFSGDGWKNKIFGCYSIRYSETELDRFLSMLDSRFFNEDNEKGLKK